MIGLLLAAVLTAGAAEPAGRVVDRVAATVNDDLVTLTEVYELGSSYIDESVRTSGEQSRARAEGEVLEHLIERKLVAQEVSRLNLDVTEQDVDRAVDDTAKRNNLDRDQLRVELEKQGMQWDDYRDEMKESIRDVKFAQNVLRPRITITEDELKDAWLRSQGAGTEMVELQALVLAVPRTASDAEREGVRARAAAIVAEANGGKPFDVLARAYDEGPYGVNGGEMGRFKQGELVDTIDRAAFSTPVGSIAVVELGTGVMLVRVKSKGTESAAGEDFEEHRTELTEALFEGRMEAEKDRWYQQARRRAVVKVLLPGAS